MTYNLYSTVGRGRVQTWLRSWWPNFGEALETNPPGWARRLHKWNGFNSGPIHAFHRAIFRYARVGYSYWARYDPSDEEDLAEERTP